MTIPDDIMRAAETVAAKTVDRILDLGDIIMPAASRHVAVEVIARAIMARDERAIQAAKNAILRLSEDERRNGDICHDAIATAIRNGERG